LKRVVGLVSLALALLPLVACQRGAREDEMVSSRANAGSQPTSPHGVSGRVTTADGKPIVRTMVQAESLDNPKQAIPEIGVLTGKDGSYLWPLRPGRYRLTIKAEGYPPVSREVVVRPNEAAHLDFTLKK
jgi:hypothetical protein